MSMVSTQPAPPGNQEQESVSLPALPEVADPSGFTERAPALLSLLPDEALSAALAGADAFAVHAALTARLARESSGSVRDTLRELLGNQTLFVMAERPPRLGSILGTGVVLAGLPTPEKRAEPFIATRAVSLFGLPVWPLGEHLVRRGRDGQLEVVGRVAAARGARVSRAAGLLAVAGLGLAGAGLALAPFFTREVQLVNGLSRPVEVRLDEQVLTLKPGEVARRQLYSLGEPYHVEARWPGEAKPFEELSLEASQRALYNVLGAASLSVGNPQVMNGLARMEGSTRSLGDDENMQWQGGWQDKVRELKVLGRWEEAAELCKTIFLADASMLQAGEEAAHLLALHNRDSALGFARLSQAMFPENPAVNRLVQDLFMAVGGRKDAFTLYEGLARQAPQSLPRALLVARVTAPTEQREAYARVLERFPQAPEAMRAMARVQLADGYAKDALKLLDDALAKAPETLEDVEVRVRALISLKQFQQASVMVHQFAVDPRHGSWELALLAGRLAQVTGPARTQYVTRDLIPPSVTASLPSMVAFTLLTGEGTVSDAELKSVPDRSDQEMLGLTRTLLRDFDKAVPQARTTSDKVRSSLDVESAAVLALELSRLGEQQAASRMFNSSLQLMAAREPLESYVRSGQVEPDFPLLPPGLQAAAYLVRARAVPAHRQEQLDYARATDVLSGMARRALDAGYEEPAPREEYEPPRYYPHHQHYNIITIIRGENMPPPPPPPPPRPRLPRPWSAP
jgi:tetratricopeptide (TPR) repeat protein